MVVAVDSCAQGRRQKNFQGGGATEKPKNRKIASLSFPLILYQ